MTASFVCARNKKKFQQAAAARCILLPLPMYIAGAARCILMLLLLAATIC
jgi:hypothetical protein